MREFRTFTRLVCATSAALLVAAAAASATPINLYFTQITSDGTVNVESQLRAEVTPGPSAGQVMFKFFNDVGIVSDSSITDIYFDDGTLLGIASITSSGPGVVFHQFAHPGNLPGANNITPGFETTAGFSLDSDSPVAPNGVDSADEWVAVTFTLINGQTYADTLAALVKPPGTYGGLRVGIKVQSIHGRNDWSNGFVNNPPDIPVPDSGTTAAMLALSLGAVAVLARRKL
jgi:hypothetical protein